MESNKLSAIFSRIKPVELFLICLVLLLFAYSYFFSGTKEQKAQTQTQEATTLEMRMEQVLSQMQGVGEVRVIISWEEEESITAFSSQKETKTPRGAVVVAQGADDLRVRMELLRAAQALLHIPAQSVEVFSMQPILKEDEP